MHLHLPPLNAIHVLKEPMLILKELLIANLVQQATMPAKREQSLVTLALKEPMLTKKDQLTANLANQVALLEVKVKLHAILVLQATMPKIKVPHLVILVMLVHTHSEVQ